MRKPQKSPGSHSPAANGIRDKRIDPSKRDGRRFPANSQTARPKPSNPATRNRTPPLDQLGYWPSSTAQEGPWPERPRTDIDRVRMRRYTAGGEPSYAGIWTDCEGGGARPSWARWARWSRMWRIRPGSVGRQMRRPAADWGRPVAVAAAPAGRGLHPGGVQQRKPSRLRFWPVTSHLASVGTQPDTLRRAGDGRPYRRSPSQMPRPFVSKNLHYMI